jgi:hypothetical protein
MDSRRFLISFSTMATSARVIQRDAFVHLALLGGGREQAQRVELLLLARLHCGLDVFVQLFAKRHAGPPNDRGERGIAPGSPREFVSWPLSTAWAAASARACACSGGFTAARMLALALGSRLSRRTRAREAP